MISGIKQLSTTVRQMGGEIATLTKNKKDFNSLKITIPISIVREWDLKSGDKLEFFRKIIDNEIAVVMRKVKVTTTTTSAAAAEGSNKRKSKK